ncbi:MAG: ATP-binding cassette domain-containing protein, partial [candidate division Zixibacteria bacterium]
MIQSENLTYRYPGADKDAICDLTLAVSSGERLALMGGNGSGKSTLARLFAALLTPDSGRLFVNGASDASSDNQASSVGILFQNPDNQMVSVLVDKEIAFALENRGATMVEMERGVKRSLQCFGISHLARRLTSELSGGEKQRVALSAITVDQPRLLLLDEPDSYLDRAGRQLLKEQLLKLRQAVPDLTEIRITQYPEVARTYPRLVVLKDGQIVFDGEPEKFFSDRAQVSSCRLSFEPDQQSDRMASDFSPASLNGKKSLQVEKLTFGHSEDRTLFNEATFSLESGEIVALVGPTGCGKSTLGHILCGLIQPDSGRVRLTDDGLQVSEDKRAGMVSGVLQQPERQFFLPSCNEEVAFGPSNLGQSLSTDQIEAYLRQVRLAPDEFSARDPL